MPYRELDSFLSYTQVNVVKIYDFPGDEYDEPALVPVDLADEILRWLEKKSTQLGYQKPVAQAAPKKSPSNEPVKVFSAP